VKLEESYPAKSITATAEKAWIADVHSSVDHDQ
jgi:hypothetical protein